MLKRNDEPPKSPFAVLREVLGTSAALRAYLVWVPRPRDDGGFDKLPCEPTTGSTAKPNSARNRATLTYNEAVAAAGKLSDPELDYGIGLLASRADLWPVDIDRVVGPDGKIAAWAMEIAKTTYWEISPSCKGLRLIFRSVPPEIAAIANGVERNQIGIYGALANKFTTLTGNVRGEVNEIADMTPEVAALILKRWKAGGKAKGMASRPWTGHEAGDGYPRGQAGMDVAAEDVLSGAALHPALTAFLVRAARVHDIETAEELAWELYHASAARQDTPDRWAARSESIPGIIKWIREQGGYIRPAPSPQRSAGVKGLIVSLAEARAKRGEVQVIEAEDDESRGFDPEDIGPGPWVLEYKHLFKGWRFDLTETEARYVQRLIGKRWQDSGLDGAHAVGILREETEGAQKLDGLHDFFAEQPVPPWPEGIFPEVVETYLNARAEAGRFDRGALGVSMLAMMAGAVGSIQMVKLGPEWRERAILWTITVAAPSAKKSPIMNAAFAPLEGIEKDGRVHYAREVKKAQAKGGSKDEIAKHVAEIEEPPRFMTGDVTIEKLGAMLADDRQQDRGIIMKRDEMEGWISGMDAYKSRPSGERSKWLTAFGGGYETIDRITRGEIMVQNFAVSLAGNIPVKRLAELGTGEGLSNDGMLQRMLHGHIVRVEPSPLGVDPEVEARLIRLGKDLRFAAGQATAVIAQRTWELSPEALEVTQRFQREVMPLRQDSSRGDGFMEWAGKLDAQFGRVCLVLAAFENPRGEVIAGEVAERVERLFWAYLIPSAVRVFEIVDGQRGEDHRAVASWMLRMDHEGRNDWTFRDLSRSGPPIFRQKSAGAIRDKLEAFELGGWIEYPKDEPGNAAKFTITKGVAERWHDEREAARERFEAVRKKLGGAAE